MHHTLLNHTTKQKKAKLWDGMERRRTLNSTNILLGHFSNTVLGNDKDEKTGESGTTFHLGLPPV